MGALNRAELTAALEKNERRINHAVSRLAKSLNEEQWQETIDLLAELRNIQEHLSEQLKALPE
jgi:hypothetical protein